MEEGPLGPTNESLFLPSYSFLLLSLGEAEHHVGPAMADRSKEVGTKRLHVEQAHRHGAEESFQVWRNWSSAIARGGGLLGS